MPPNSLKSYAVSPFDMDEPMVQVRQLDKRMNDAGLLRLMVSDPLAMNMSNTLGYLRGELKKERGKKITYRFQISAGPDATMRSCRGV